MAGVTCLAGIHLLRPTVRGSALGGQGEGGEKHGETDMEMWHGRQ